MPFITDRDIKIFKALMAGPSTIQNLIKQSNFKTMPTPIRKKPEEKKSNENRDKKYFAFKQRLHLLKKDKYLKSQHYCSKNGKGVFALYALTPYSIAALKEAKINTNVARVTFPNKFTVTHELEVTAVVRALKEDSAKWGYEFMLEDENTLKSRSKGTKKKIPYPDLHITTAYRDQAGRKWIIEAAIEIDNDTIDAPVVAAKIKTTYEDLKWNVAVLTTTRERMEKIKRALALILERDRKLATSAEDILRVQKIYQIAFFGTQADFCARGLIDMSDAWSKADGRIGSLIPRDAIIGKPNP